MNRELQVKTLAAAMLLALASGNAAAAKRVELGKLDLKAMKKQFDAAAGLVGVPKMNHSRHEMLLGVEQDSYLVMQSSNRSGKAVNRRYVQTFRGLPIFGENLVVSEDGQGDVKALFGRKIDGLASEIASITPRISKDQALAAAKKATLGKRTVVGNEKVDLQIYVDEKGKAYLAYAVDFVADTPRGDSLSRPMVVVDANTGRVLLQYENLQTELIGTGPGGNQKTGQYEYGSNGKGYLDVTKVGTTCSLESDNAKTIDANHYTGPGFPNQASFDYTKPAYSFECPRNTFQTINGGYSPLNDVHYFGNVVFKMYNDWTGANPLTTKLKSAVHYGTGWENAAWNGTGMVYGDGSNTFYPLTSLDVTSHEVSHGFTNQNSNLGPYYGSQAGCMNEAYSDMSGEAAEYYDRGSNDWMVGQEIFKSADATKALRYMDDPAKDGRSISNASQYNTSVDPHLCSGVYNKAFYTLAHKAGWTTKTAWQSFQRANRDYWTSSATFDTGAVGVLKAACDLGFNGQDVKDSFTAVGVNAGAVPAGCGGGNPPPANNPPVANFTSARSGLKVTFTDTSTDNDGNIAARSWDFGDGTSSTQANPVKTYNAAGTFTVTLTVTDDDGATNTKTASVTVTNTAPVANFTSATNGLTATFTDSSSDSDGSIASRSWDFGDGTTSTQTNPSKTYSTAGTYTVKLTVTDNAGGTNTKTGSVTVSATGGGGGGALTNGVAKTNLSGATGSTQIFTLEVPAGATGLKFVTSGGTGDVDMYVKFNGTPSTANFDCKSEGPTTAETCNIPVAQAGTYSVLLNGYAAYSGVSLTGSYTAGGGTGGTQTYSNGTDVAIPDNATVTSAINVAGRAGSVALGTVSVNIQHTYRGEVKVELVAPDGAVYLLKNYNLFDSADNVVQTWSLNMSGRTLNGAWTLRVTDSASGDTGKIDNWSMTF